MTHLEFEESINKGDKLVILDNLVLDISAYRCNHPGGKFVLDQNIGRDISKFFYGGYILENYSGMSTQTHSNIARLIVNSIVIAKLTGLVPQAIG
jgi:cytochrome b involved in lipid metabolism